jgi:hypothetical protein
VAARGAGAATGENPTHRDHRRCADVADLSAGAARAGLRRRPNDQLRVSLRQRRPGSFCSRCRRADSSPGRSDCDLRHHANAGGQGGHHDDSDRHDRNRRSGANRSGDQLGSAWRQHHRQYRDQSGPRGQATGDPARGDPARVARRLSRKPGQCRHHGHPGRNEAGGDGRGHGANRRRG